MSLSSVVQHSFRNYPKIIKWNKSIYYMSGSSRSKSLDHLKDFVRKSAVDIVKTTKHNRCGAVFQSLHILGSGAAGQRSLLLSTSRGDYLFNCGEGTGRISKEYKKSFSVLREVFVTHSSWQNVAGLTELKQATDGKPSTPIIIHGSPEVCSIWKSIDTLNTQFVKIENQHHNDSDEFQTRDGCKVKSLVLEADCSLKKHKPSYAYILKSEQQRRRIDPQKLIDFKVPSGAPLVQLRNGESIMLKNGNMVYPQDVTHKLLPTPTIIVLEVPTLDHLDALVSHKGFHAHHYATASDQSDFPAVVVHFSSREVVADQRYEHFVQQFSPSTYHLLLNESSTCLGLTKLYQKHHILHCLWPRAYPKLFETSTKQDAGHIPRGCLVNGRGNLGYVFDKTGGSIDSSRCAVPKESTELQRILSENSVNIKFKHHQQKLAQVSQSSMQTPMFPHIIFLGTGSASASQYRSVSGILLKISETQCALLDCGIGSFSQLVRLQGYETALQTTMQTQLIFITHHHGDHHLGLITFLSQRQHAFRHKRLQASPIYVLAGNRILTYLQQFNRHFDSVFENVHFINNYDLIHNRDKIDTMLYGPMCNLLDLDKLQATYVRHCHESCAISITHKQGWHIVFSGDCKPSPELVKMGKGCDLLIHEATFEDCLEREATLKQHSTISQALSIAKQMRADKTILTHFSQRYCHLPLLTKPLPDNVGVAFDFCKVTLGQDPAMKLFYPTLKELLHNIYYTMQQDTNRKLSEYE